MVEEHREEPKCFLIREETIRRLPRVVFAASEGWRRHAGDFRQSMEAFSKAIGAKCTRCGLVLSGEELLALAGISSANEESVMLKRLHAGQCACENCSATHYRLSFYDTPHLNWSKLLTISRPKEESQPQPAPVRKLVPPQRIAPVKFGRAGRTGIAVGICLLAWICWRAHTGGRIPILREPEHFRVTPSPVDPPVHRR